MFLPNSRYFNVEQVDVTQPGGRIVRAVKFRRLPKVVGSPVAVKGNDQLDVMSQRNFNDATMYWHIADANTELRANDLLRPVGRVIDVPEK